MTRPRADDLLTISEAARLVGLSRQAVEIACTRGTIPVKFVKVPVARVRRADILAHAKRTGRKRGRPRL